MKINADNTMTFSDAEREVLLRASKIAEQALLTLRMRWATNNKGKHPERVPIDLDLTTIEYRCAQYANGCNAL